MELSQSQDLCSEATNNHRGDNGFIASLPEEGATKSGRTGFFLLSVFYASYSLGTIYGEYSVVVKSFLCVNFHLPSLPF